MPKADARTVAGLLREYAHRTALRNGHPHRARAYSRAADSLAALTEPLDSLVAQQRLTEIPGSAMRSRTLLPSCIGPPRIRV
ncbi:hypothetical protein [Bradyrhizobium sp. USDA 4516]